MILVVVAAAAAGVAVLVLNRKKAVPTDTQKASRTTEQAGKEVEQIVKETEQEQTVGISCTCGMVNPATVKFCPGCGKPVAVPGRCPSCGHQNDPAARFCQGCDKSLDGSR